MGVKKFPGTRVLRNGPVVTLEFALIADGFAPDQHPGQRQCFLPAMVIDDLVQVPDIVSAANARDLGRRGLDAHRQHYCKKHCFTKYTFQLRPHFATRATPKTSYSDHAEWEARAQKAKNMLPPAAAQTWNHRTTLSNATSQKQERAGLTTEPTNTGECHMNKLMSLVATAASLAVATLVSSVQANAGTVLDNVLKSKTLTVAVGTDWGAMSHLDEKHELVGYDVDVAKGIAKSLGVDAKFVTPGWDIIIGGKWQGRWDMAMGGITPTTAREAVFDFPAFYYYEDDVVVVHKDSKATKLADLDGKTVGTLSPSILEDYANHKFKPEWKGAKPINYQFKPGAVKGYTSSNVSYDDLRLGDGVRLDGVITNKLSVNNAIKAGYPIKVLGDPLFSSPGAITVGKGDKEFNDKIAASVKEMKDDGTLSKLSVKWFGEDIITGK